MRRRQILDATFRSIVANGLAKTTLATVAGEAGLSQGVAVFYFKSKGGLLAEALRDQYQKYEDRWQSKLSKSAQAPAGRLRAIIEADFAPDICNSETLSVWFAFWGEQKFTPQYAEVTEEFIARRTQAIREICAELVPEDPTHAVQAAEWIDSFTDGCWQKLHLFPKDYSREHALETTFGLLRTLFPDEAAAF
ncbi:TetR family transcriptional regulator C-terminal domain-containing protein [Pseudophaeobacter leonis]|uniref:TetR family transcriptional regulator C-terminal domain-containing protein n=1 Tax=Pseudophaeobacter leonis TaxID=1144477 RepID=UPI001F4DC1A4|nr:TetR family transcriptional regulator C-terminal domain-containing protein [Pseudophaeobacter leonis]